MIEQLYGVEPRIIWQSNDNCGSEHAIVIQRYHGTVDVSQNGSSIVVLETHVEELIKALRQSVKVTIK